MVFWSSSALAAAAACPAAAAAVAPWAASPLSRVASRCAEFEGRGQGRDLALVGALLRALEREQVGQLLDLPVEPCQRLVLAGHLARQEELRQHEHGEEKDDDEQHRRQGVDEARPVIDRLVAASARQRHVELLCSPLPACSPSPVGERAGVRGYAERRRSASPLIRPFGPPSPRKRGEGTILPRRQLFQQAAQELADVLLLLGLHVDPVADLLLLGPHVADQRLDALGEGRDRRGVALVLDRGGWTAAPGSTGRLDRPGSSATWLARNSSNSE